ncbi:MAG: RagB/SusD family nutrient uptake outer membrane protein [Prevotellaceae bacterium]|nr:RagB/SusD family nutrient uptake outer membrane protein [Prevotellaceae bacterium]
MKKKILYMAAALVMSVGFSSCDLDEYNPSAGDATIDDYSTWAGLQTQCYSTLYHELYSKQDFYFISECGTDLWLNPSGVAYSERTFYYDGLGVASQEPQKTWEQAYAVIATCNSVINNTPTADESEQDDIRILKAEAKTIRAFMHLTLATYFGPITLCTVEVGEEDRAPVRNSLEEVYTSITTDLKEAAEDLEVDPYDGNYARVCKKTALGLLARAYAQGAGEGLEENGVSYWQRAKEVAEDMITNASSYGMYLYPDVADLWAQENNRGNAESLFTAAGLDATNSDAANAGLYANYTCTLGGFTLCDPNSLSRMYGIQMAQNQYLGIYGTTGRMAPTKHAIDVFGDWDKRYENSFLTAFGTYTYPTGAAYSFANQRLGLTSLICRGIDIDTKFEGDTIYPYVALATSEQPGGTQTYATGVYEKGGTRQTVSTKNAFVVDMPLDQDEDRIRIYLSKDDLTAEEKQQYRCFTINISELFDANGEYLTGSYSDRGMTAYVANAYSLFPSLIKFDYLFDGATRQLSTDTYPYRNGDVFIMRAAEIYMIAAEANVMLGNESAAIPYIQTLHNRAVRSGSTAPTITSVDEQYILDEYAREFVGEHMRWAVLKRHRASGLMKQAIETYNTRAASNFDESIHYCRPIPQKFLDQISNAEEYGDNGYGYTANKGY